MATFNAPIIAAFSTIALYAFVYITINQVCANRVLAPISSQIPSSCIPDAPIIAALSPNKTIDGNANTLYAIDREITTTEVLYSLLYSVAPNGFSFFKMFYT